MYGSWVYNMIFKRKKKYSPEEINDIINKAVIDTQEQGFFIISEDVPTGVMELILEATKLAASRERLNLWRERRHNRRWV